MLTKSGQGNIPRDAINLRGIKMTNERETLFKVEDSQLGKVKLQKKDNEYFLYVGNRDIQVDTKLSTPAIVGSGTRFI